MEAHTWILDLDGNLAPVVEDSTVDLPDGCGGDGHFVEGRELRPPLVSQLLA